MSASVFTCAGQRCVLSRTWRSTREIALATGSTVKHARRQLGLLEQAGVVERAVRGDAAELWRLREGHRA